MRMAADQERAERIKALKQGRPDLTWRRIADYVGVTERSATDWQSKGGIDYGNAEKLAALFEVDIDYIWRGDSAEDRAPTPFAGPDALAERFDELERRVMAQLAEHARTVEGLLRRQDEILARIEARISDDHGVRDEIADLIDRTRRGIVQAGPLAGETDPPRDPAPTAAAAKPRAKARRTR